MANPPRWLPTNRLRLEIEGFLESRRQDGCRAVTVDGYYRKKLVRFLDFATHQSEKQVTPEVVRRFFGTIAGQKQNSRATYLRALKTFYNWLIWEKIVSTSAVYEARVRIPYRRKIKELPAPTSVTDTLVAMRRACYGTKDLVFDRLRDLALLHFVLETGLRRAELARMTVGDTHVDDGRARIAGKTDDRIVHFPYSREALRFYLEERARRFGAPQPQDPFWLNKWGGALTVDGLSQAFERVKRRHGLKVTPHLVRALSATWAAAEMIKQGADRGSVGLMLESQYGWKDPRTPRIYIDLAADEELRKSVHERYSPLNRLRVPRQTRRKMHPST
jgi:site-specific recombinase XerD